MNRKFQIVDLNKREIASAAHGATRHSYNEPPIEPSVFGLKLIYHALRHPHLPLNLVTVAGIADFIVSADMCVAVLECLHEIAMRIEDDWAANEIDWFRYCALKKLECAIEKPEPHDSSRPYSDRFSVDVTKLEKIIQKTVGGRQNLELSYIYIRQIIGIKSGLIQHKSKDHPIPNEDYFHPDRFETSPTYSNFVQKQRETLETTVAESTTEELAQNFVRMHKNYGWQTVTLQHLYQVLLHAEKSLPVMKELISASPFKYAPVDLALTEYFWTIASDEEKIQLEDCRNKQRVTHGFTSDKQVNELIAKAGIGNEFNYQDVFEAIRTLIGLRSGLIAHKKPLSEIPLTERYNRDLCCATEQYQIFLNSYEFSLDETTDNDDRLRVRIWNGAELHTQALEVR